MIGILIFSKGDYTNVRLLITWNITLCGSLVRIDLLIGRISGSEHRVILGCIEFPLRCTNIACSHMGRIQSVKAAMSIIATGKSIDGALLHPELSLRHSGARLTHLLWHWVLSHFYSSDYIDRVELPLLLPRLVGHRDIIHRLRLTKRHPGAISLIHHTGSFIWSHVLVISMGDGLKLSSVRSMAKLIDFGENWLS